MVVAESGSIRLEARRVDEALHLGDTPAACNGCSGCGWLPRQSQRIPAFVLDEGSSQDVAHTQAGCSDVITLHAQVDQSALARVVAVLFATLLGVLVALVLLAEVLSIGILATVVGVSAGLAAIFTLFRQQRQRIEQAIALRLSLAE